MFRTSHSQQNDEYLIEISTTTGNNLETSFESIERITEEVRKFQTLSKEVDRQQLEFTESSECSSVSKDLKVDLNEIHLKTPQNNKESENIVEFIDLEVFTFF